MIVLPFPGSMDSSPWGRGPDLLRECLKGIKGHRLTTGKQWKGQVSATAMKSPGRWTRSWPSWTLTRPRECSEKARPVYESLWANAEKKEARGWAGGELWGAQCQTPALCFQHPQSTPSQREFQTPFHRRNRLQELAQGPETPSVKPLSSPSATTGVHCHASASLPLLFFLVWGAFQKYTFLRRPTESENVGGPDTHLKFFPE